MVQQHTERKEKAIILDQRLKQSFVQELKKGFKFSGVLCPLRGFLELLHFEMYIKTYDLETNIEYILEYISEVFDQYIDLLLTVTSFYDKKTIRAKFPLSYIIFCRLQKKFKSIHSQ